MEVKKYLETCLLRINKGDILLYEGGKVIVLDFYLTPNGMTDPKVVAVIVARRCINKNIVEATSDKFQAIKREQYQEKLYT